MRCPDPGGMEEGVKLVLALTFIAICTTMKHLLPNMEVDMALLCLIYAELVLGKGGSL